MWLMLLMKQWSKKLKDWPSEVLKVYFIFTINKPVGFYDQQFESVKPQSLSTFWELHLPTVRLEENDTMHFTN